MYIVYDKCQRPTTSFECDLENYTNHMCVPKFKPTWLVRVSDMKVIPGSSVENEHYWALSYSWNQSGKLIHMGGDNYDRVDEGQHQIITYQYDNREITAGYEGDPWYWPSKSIGEYIYKLMYGDTAENIHRKRFAEATKVVRYVQFEELIQEICKDFRIKYIWYDQLCINQGDHDEKLREIKQMHFIYTYARCTLALIPELDTEEGANTIPKSQWCSRMWTLEETYMSKNILFVGAKDHLWSHSSIEAGDFFNNVKRLDNRRFQTWKACTALSYARTRTSTKAHDKVFALVNIFPEIKSCITFNYRQPVLDLMVSFYGLLLEQDQTMLLYGVPINDSDRASTTVTRQCDAIKLPSWTGGSGGHIPTNGYSTLYQDFARDSIKVTGECMRLTSTSIAIHVESAASEKEYPILSRQDAKCGLHVILSDEAHSSALSGSIDSLISASIAEEAQDYYCSYTRGLGLRATHFLPIATEGDNLINTFLKPAKTLGFLSITEECSDCFILADFRFRYSYYKIYPVIKEDKGYYKSVGVCLLYDRCLLDPALIQLSRVFDIY